MGADGGEGSEQGQGEILRKAAIIVACRTRILATPGLTGSVDIQIISRLS